VAKPKANTRNQKATEPGGLWHQPALMNLLADVLTVLAVAGLAWAGLTALQRLPLFPLRELVLTSAPVRVSTDQLEHATRKAVAGNFFTVDLDTTRDAIEKLPWVRKAAVRRQWPDGLSLVLEEHEAVARWRRLNGELALVNRQGEVFQADFPTGASALPQLTGPEGSAPELLQRYAEFSGTLATIGRRVDRVVLTPRLAWQIKLDDGVAIDLGRDQLRHPLGERLERFVSHYSALRQRVGTMRVADMRYPNGFVLRGIENTPAAVTGRKS
jgi:cell division protein FtsQ